MVISFLSALILSGTAFAQFGGTTGISGTTTMHGFSNYFETSATVSPNEYTIYAGRTVVGCTNSDITKPCDSCASIGSNPINGNMVCSRTEVYPDLRFSVTLSSTTPAAYSAASCIDKAIMMRASGVTSNFVFPLANSQVGYVQNGTGSQVTVSFSWSQIWDAMQSGSGGSASLAKTLEFGFNSGCSDTAFVDVGLRLNVKYRYLANSQGPMNFPCDGTLQPYSNEGICSFKAERGDGKIYLTNVAAPQGSSVTLVAANGANPLPDSADPSGMAYNRLRIFCKPGSGSYASLTLNDFCGDLLIDGRTLNNAKIEGLQNGTQYELLAANVDQSGIVSLFSNPGNVGNLGVATPAAVSGLLDDKKCFIATAAFGSPMEEHVVRFRAFRDQVLMRTSFGRAFVEFYYEYSPDAAKFIQSNEVLKTVTRFLLYPILFFAEMVMKFGWIFPIFALIFVIGVVRAQKQRIRREKT